MSCTKSFVISLPVALRSIQGMGYNAVQLMAVAEHAHYGALAVFSAVMEVKRKRKGYGKRFFLLPFSSEVCVFSFQESPAEVVLDTT